MTIPVSHCNSWNFYLSIMRSGQCCSLSRHLILIIPKFVHEWKLVNHCCWETIQLKLSVLKTSNYFQVPLWIDQYYLHMENQLTLCLHTLQPLSQFGFFKNDTFKFVIMELFLSSDVLTVVFNKINTYQTYILWENISY